jgi:hypothetical protein
MHTCIGSRQYTAQSVYWCAIDAGDGCSPAHRHAISVGAGMLMLRGSTTYSTAKSHISTLFPSSQQALLEWNLVAMSQQSKWRKYPSFPS